MLTNTVILLLRELMPLCLLFAFMLVLRPQFFANRVFVAGFFLTCLLVPFLFFTIAEATSDAFDGKGAELIGVSLLLIHFVFLLISTLLPLQERKTAFFMAAGAVALVTHKGSSLILYLDIYAKQSVYAQSLIVGILIGLGICLSLLVLFRFLLSELYSHQKYSWVMAFWLLYLSGNTAEVSNLLLQVNAVEWGANTLFDVSHYIQDASEYGHLLNALIGFDASPTILYVAIYLSCLSLASVVLIVRCISLRTHTNRYLPSHSGVKV